MATVKVEKRILNIFVRYYENLPFEQMAKSESDVDTLNRLAYDYHRHGFAHVPVNFLTGTFAKLFRAIDLDNLPDGLDRLNVSFAKCFFDTLVPMSS